MLYLPTALVVQVKQSVSFVCVSVCTVMSITFERNDL